jgi:hypothetical protein
MPPDQGGDAGVSLLAETVSAYLAAGTGLMGSPEVAVIAATLAPALTQAFMNIANRVSSLRHERCGEDDDWVLLERCRCTYWKSRLTS